MTLDNNNRGFTLLESLISLFILSLLLLYITPFIKMMVSMDERAKNDTYVELQIGKIQLEREMSALAFVEVKNNKLVFLDDSGEHPEKYKFEHYKNMIRKTPGHQPIIMGVQTVRFAEVNQNIRMSIKMTDGRRYTYYFNEEMKEAY